MRIILLAFLLPIFFSETAGHIRYWTAEEVDLIERELKEFQKIDEDRDAQLVAGLTGSVYVLQNKMSELARDLEKGSGKGNEEGSGQLEAAIGSLSANMENLKMLLEKAKRLSSEYAAAQLQKHAEEQEKEEEEEWMQEEDQTDSHSAGEQTILS